MEHGSNTDQEGIEIPGSAPLWSNTSEIDLIFIRDRSVFHPWLNP